MRDISTGDYHAKRKLTREQAQEIRSKYKPGETTYQQLADEYDVDIGIIMNIIRNRTYYERKYKPKNSEVSIRRKLTQEDAHIIRERYKTERITLNALAREFGVPNSSVVGNIIHNKTYRDPDYTPPSSKELRQRALTITDAYIIRERYKTERIALSALAREFGVSNSVVGNIIHNKTYCDPNYTPPSDDERRHWKLSNEDITAIISEAKLDRTKYKDLAKKYGIHPTQITNIVRRNGIPPRVASSKRPSSPKMEMESGQIPLL